MHEIQLVTHFGEKNPTKMQFCWIKNINYGHICFDEGFPLQKFDDSKETSLSLRFSIPHGIFP